MLGFHKATLSNRNMSNCVQEEFLNGHLEALGRLERRRVLLRLANATPHNNPCIDFSDVEPTAEERDPLVPMRHLHLPVLEEYGFIQWDRKNHRVTKGPRFNELEPFLKLYHDLHRDLLAK